MKQHITIDNLKEIKGKAWKELLNYCGNNKISNVLLSIGQMVEFLSDKNIIIEQKEGGWEVQYVAIVNGKSELFYHFYEELCDSLWQAVKENLVK